MNSPILLRQPNLGWPVRKKWRVRLGIVVGLLKKQRSSDVKKLLLLSISKTRLSTSALRATVTPPLRELSDGYGV
jgi:hypothetical protein